MNKFTKQTNNNDSVHTYFRSVSNETKERFDALLKNALLKQNQPEHKSNGQLKKHNKNEVKNVTEQIELNIINTNANESNDNFILEKFLTDAVNSNLNENLTSHPKPPVPLPRKKKTIKQPKSNENSIDSDNRTYSIKSEIIGSNSSKGTYNIQNEAVSTSSKGTYNISKASSAFSKNSVTVPVGDVLIHNDNSLGNKIVIIEDKKLKTNTKPEPEQDSNRNKMETQTETSSNCDYFLGIIIYKTDLLQLNSLINHPCVKIHIVDSETGEYIKRRNGNGFENSNYFIPLMTKSCNLQEKRSLIPHWDELITFDLNFNDLLDSKNSIMIFFEILDFLSFSIASENYEKQGSNSGWYRIAWAFLKPIGSNDHFNTERNVRLQLYKPKKLTKKFENKCALHDWWLNGNFTKYSSTLYVHVKKIKAKSLKNSDVLKKLNIEESIGINSNNKIEESNEYGQTRLKSQSCKIPNKIFAKLKSGSKGCFMLRFSHEGLLLACGLAEATNYPILIYTVLNKTEYCKFSGHQGLIYDLQWSKDDKYLISASADYTIFIWNIITKQYHPIQVLPHPSFVYCCIFRNHKMKSLVITGCYDQTIRVWASIGSDYELVQELYDHNGYVTALCFGNEEDVFYSADSTGIVVEWIFNSKSLDWILQKHLKFRELQNTIINNLILHPNGNKLLICGRDSVYRMVDLKVCCIVQWFRGLLNDRLQLTACISPCGNLIFGPSEDGTICIWDAYTGILQATFTPYLSTSSMDPIVAHCVQYHSNDHTIAIAHYGSVKPVLLCVFHQTCTGLELHLKSFVPFQSSKTEMECSNDTNGLDRKLININNNDRKHVNLDVIIRKIDDVLMSAKN